MSPLTQLTYIPDTMAAWPWQRVINPYYEEVKAESNAWFQSFKPFTAASQRAFDKCDFCLLASLAYPRASKEHLRTGCDLMNLFFLIDEYTDVENADVVREMVDIVIEALKYPHAPRPDGELLLGEVTRQFWERAIATATPTSQRHFIETFTEYLDSVVDQAADRDEDTIRTVESYMRNRKENIGSRPSYAVCEMGLELPDGAFYHPAIVELSDCATDMLILDNDLVSYNREVATGEARHNVLTVVMHEKQMDLKTAVKWVVQYHKDLEERFMQCITRIPSFGPRIDAQLREYVQGIANWPRANDCWSFESGRYFGSKGREIQKTRRVPVFPQMRCNTAMRKEQVVIASVDL